MRKGLVIVGVILLIVGLLAAGLTYQQSTTISPVSQPSEGANTAMIGTVLGGTMTIAWSGGTSDTELNVYHCDVSSCSSLGPIIASGKGASGSMTFGLTSGTSYAFTASTSGVSATATTDGFAILTLVGIVLAAIGAFLLVIGAMARPRVRASPQAVPEATGPVGVIGAIEAAPGEPDQGHIMQARATPADAPQAMPGQMIKCESCGTLNEMWLHNCRWCKRPLTTTAGDR